MKTTGYNSLKSYGIVVACSAIYWVISMPHRMSGLLFVAFTERYHADRGSASLPTTIYTMLRCFGGPLAAYLAEIIGIRNVTIIGCLLASVGVGACFFAETMTEVTICLGLVFGVGFFLTNSLMPHMLKLHFNEKLASANGLRLAGSSLGAFVHPPLIKYLLKEYGLSGTFLLVAGIMLNGVPIAMLLHDPKYPKEEVVEYSKSENETFGLCRTPTIGKEHLSHTEDSKYPREDIVEDSKSECEAFAICRTPLIGRKHSIGTEDRKSENETFAIRRTSSIGKEPLNLTEDSKSENEIFALSPTPSIDGKEHFTPTENSKSSSPTNYQSETFILCENSATEKEHVNPMGDSKCTTYTFAMCGNSLESSNQTLSISQLTNKHESVVLMCADALTETETLNQTSTVSKLINSHKPVVDIRILNTHFSEILPSNATDKSEKNIDIPLKLPAQDTDYGCHTNLDQTHLDCGKGNSSLNVKIPQKYKRALRIFLVFKDLPFLVYMLCFSLHIYIVVIMWIILMDVSKDKGLDDSLEVYYLMLLPIAEIIGNSSFGLITDYGYLSKSNYTGICFVILGASCALLAWAQSFATVMFSLLCFGVCTDATGICAPGLAYQFMDESKQTMAIASRYVLYVPLSFTAAPMIGYFRGTLGSYDGVLYMLTSLSTFSGVLMMLLPYIAKCSKPKKRGETNSVGKFPLKKKRNL